MLVPIKAGLEVLPQEAYGDIELLETDTLEIIVEVTKDTLTYLLAEEVLLLRRHIHEVYGDEITQTLFDLTKGTTEVA